MKDLNIQVREHLFENTDLEIEEVYQVYQGNASNIIAEIRFIKDGETIEAIATISRYKTRIEPVENSQKEFVEMVKDCN